MREAELLLRMEVERVEACQSPGELALARCVLPDEPHIHEAARRIIRERGWQCYPCGTTVDEWTDWTLERLRWRLDADKRENKRLLVDWQRSVAYGILSAAKREGADYRIPPDRMAQVRDILRAKVSEAVVDEGDEP